jgi:hypothetical protein
LTKSVEMFANFSIDGALDWLYLLKYRILPTDTTYLCHVFKGPTHFSTQQNIIAVDALSISIL